MKNDDGFFLSSKKSKRLQGGGSKYRDIFLIFSIFLFIDSLPKGRVLKNRLFKEHIP